MCYLWQQEGLGFIMKSIQQQSQSLPDHTHKHREKNMEMNRREEAWKNKTGTTTGSAPSPGDGLFDWTLLQQDAVVHGGQRLIVFFLLSNDKTNYVHSSAFLCLADFTLLPIHFLSCTRLLLEIPRFKVF